MITTRDLALAIIGAGRRTTGTRAGGIGSRAVGVAERDVIAALVITRVVLERSGETMRASCRDFPRFALADGGVAIAGAADPIGELLSDGVIEYSRSGERLRLTQDGAAAVVRAEAGMSTALRAAIRHASRVRMPALEASRLLSDDLTRGAVT